ncbi:hypothetical protein NQ315_010930 [Exocentrus adspersus]|uniref:PAT1-like protein 1 n=1 Tax=Exocentrus adspersus TaxID=1586481 RepID=A0AAV8VPN8_9CUCU|nr:hypothetical protein NQ315_010930 [Exocentrus adspersus]
MANTFFDFDTSLNNGENLLPPDEDDCLENEEEYDALNDETFGALEDASSLEDWERQHEQFAEIAESSKHSEQLENSISQLVLDDSDRLSLSNSVWSYTPPNRNGDICNTNILSSLQKASKAFIQSHRENTTNRSVGQQPVNSTPTPVTNAAPPAVRKICTVEELEKNLIKTSKPVPQQQHTQHQVPHRPMIPPPPPGHHQPHPYHPMLQHNIPPPGMSPMNIPPPGLRHMPPQMNPHHPMLPPGLLRMVPPHPQFMQANGPPRMPNFMYPRPNPGQFPVNHPFNFPPPPRNLNCQQQQRNPQQLFHQQQQHHQQQQQVRHDSGGANRQKDSQDEYAGLMSMKEKQWLLNIQMLQLNTGTPYFDDYYYTIFKERKLKSNKENFGNDKNTPYTNKRQHRNSDRQENQNTLTPRIYTPLQFENSLGKLQCGSVTAPRKIIDMDIVTPDKDTDSPQVSRDTRKTKQLLLELEALYALLLKAEDIRNPLYISNMEKLREIKQKQRLRELELAPTPEQKQEVLRLFKLESEPVVENQNDYIVKMTQGLLQEDKFCSFLNIRKGKMLVLRLLPYLTTDMFSSQLLELWSRVLLSLPIVGRRDTAGDNILPKLFPFFKKYIQSSTMSDVLDIVSGLVEVVRQENSRSTPLSHVGKSPLYFVVLNKFGVSALVTLLIRTELLISSGSVSEKQQSDWSNFLTSWALQTEAASKIALPIELIPSQIFTKHCNRFNNLKAEKKSLLEKHFVDSNTN